jgi:hypothetical protein
MKKAIVTTTINAPTEAIERFSKMNGWELIVVPDKKTPSEGFKDINCTYITLEEQQDSYRDISEFIGWNKAERRNLGFIKAYQMGFDVIATVDDDNIPYNFWGTNVRLDEEIEVDMYENINNVFDPLSVTNKKELWHRGYPLQLVNQRHDNIYLGKQKHRFYVQADLWNGEPDVDAIYRLTHKYENINFSPMESFSTVNITPFNSQNTFIHRKILKNYMMPIGLGRVHDIWGAYLLQNKTKAKVLFSTASVFQKRNEHDISKDYLDESMTYHLTLDLIKNRIKSDIIKDVEKGYDLYQSYFN